MDETGDHHVGKTRIPCFLSYLESRFKKKGVKAEGALFGKTGKCRGEELMSGECNQRTLYTYMKMS
jgi:hypothetical protein